MAANRIKVLAVPQPSFFVSNFVLIMNMKTLFKKSGTPNIVTFIINTLYQINEISRTTCKIISNAIFLNSNSTNKCTAKDHVVFTYIARVTTSNATAIFFFLGIKRF